MCDNEIIDYFYSEHEKLRRSRLKNIPDDIFQYLKNRFNDSYSLKETLFRIKNKIEIRPVCNCCGNPVEFVGIKNREYNVYCSKKCKYGDVRLQRIKQTCLDRYGVENYIQSEDAKQKIKQTCLLRYGTEKYLQSEDAKQKSKQTCLEKYGVEYTGQIPQKIEKTKKTWELKPDYEKQQIVKKTIETKIKNNTLGISDKCKRNNLIKYGVEYTFQRKDVKEKIKQTNLERYGSENVFGSEFIKNKIKQTNLERYGSENVFGSEFIKNKIKQTCLDKYGVEYYSSTPNFKEKMSAIASSESFQNRRNNTLKIHNTFCSSKDEEYCYNELCKVFEHIERQYSSKLYPFKCDFYIPSIDTYIEYNGSDLHNFKPFNNSSENIEELHILQQKSNDLKLKRNNNKKTRYDLTIYTWTNLDVRKRKIAKENNLNFIEFWNLNEFDKWIKQYAN